MFKALSAWLGRFVSNERRPCKSEATNSAIHVWTGDVSTDWGNPANWSQGVPAVQDDCEFGPTSSEKR